MKSQDVLDNSTHVLSSFPYASSHIRATQALIGAIDLEISQQHENGEIGYWLGKSFWHQGYATEAAQAVLRYGFEVVGLHRIHANYLTRNQASTRVLHKLGMCEEGCLR